MDDPHVANDRGRKCLFHNKAFLTGKVFKIFCRGGAARSEWFSVETDDLQASFSRKGMKLPFRISDMRHQAVFLCITYQLYRFRVAMEEFPLFYAKSREYRRHVEIWSHITILLRSQPRHA